MPEPETLSTAEACALLGIKPSTLYSYVSRGMIRSLEGRGRDRSRKYFAEDVHALTDRQARRRDPLHSATEALDFGPPVLASSLTDIHAGKLYYRGRDAAVLADSETFERVAALLWVDDPDRAASLFEMLVMPPAPEYLPVLPVTEWLQAALVHAAGRDLRAVDQTADGIMATGVRILGVMAGALGARGTGAAGEGIATALARGWKSDPRTLNAALILCADHELNPSSFTARVVAGTQATPYAAVTAAISALSGARHGGHTARVSALLREVSEPGRAARVIAARLRRGEDIPGFGHVLYAEGDPRAAALLNLTAERFRHAPALLLAQAVAAETLALTGKHPSIDFALVTLALAGDLPEDAALGLFALGRTAGWIAHVIEQVESGVMIRPRAQYTGK